MVPNLTIGNNNIVCVEHYKFLGLYFDTALRWKHHVTQLKISCHKVLSVLKHLSRLTWGADRVSLLRLYIMLVKPKLDYGCEAYSSVSKSVLESLEPIHNAAIRTRLEHLNHHQLLA